MGDRTVENRTREGTQPAGDGTAGAPSAMTSMAADVTKKTTRALEHGFERAGDVFWKMLKRRPYVGVGLAVGAGLGAAMVIGAAELGIGIAAGYAAYQMLKRHAPPSEALRKALNLEKDIA